jgi:choline dehydrogenase-like flavoprotein
MANMLVTAQSSTMASEEIHDFIVTGAAVAGCAVAGRLSEGSHCVLLLEAGPPNRAP